jgi:hypothetical protein
MERADEHGKDKKEEYVPRPEEHDSFFPTSLFRFCVSFMHTMDICRIYTDDDMLAKIGNVELLEATFACDEVLPTRRRPRRPVTAQFHLWILGGTHT